MKQSQIKHNVVLSESIYPELTDQVVSMLYKTLNELNLDYICEVTTYENQVRTTKFSIKTYEPVVNTSITDPRPHRRIVDLIDV